MNIAELRDAVVTTLREIDKLNATSRPPVTITVPHAFISGMTVTTSQDFDHGRTVSLDMTVLVSLAERDYAWDTSSRLVDEIEEALHRPQQWCDDIAANIGPLTFSGFDDDYQFGETGYHGFRVTFDVAT